MSHLRDCPVVEPHCRQTSAIVSCTSLVPPLPKSPTTNACARTPPATSRPGFPIPYLSCGRASAYTAAATGCRHGLGHSQPTGRRRRQCLASPARGCDRHEGIDAIRPSSGACACWSASGACVVQSVPATPSCPAAPVGCLQLSKKPMSCEQQVAHDSVRIRAQWLLRRRTAAATMCYRPRWLPASRKVQSRHVRGLSSRAEQCKRRCSSDTPSSRLLRCALLHCTPHLASTVANDTIILHSSFCLKGLQGGFSHNVAPQFAGAGGK